MDSISIAEIFGHQTGDWRSCAEKKDLKAVHQANPMLVEAMFEPMAQTMEDVRLATVPADTKGKDRRPELIVLHATTRYWNLVPWRITELLKALGLAERIRADCSRTSCGTPIAMRLLIFDH